MSSSNHFRVPQKTKTLHLPAVHIPNKTWGLDSTGLCFTGLPFPQLQQAIQWSEALSHKANTKRGFNTTGEGLWQALVRCFRTSSTGIPPVISKEQSALEWDVTAAAALCTGRGKMVTLTHTFESLSFLRVSHRGEGGKLMCYMTLKYFFFLQSVSPKACS